MASITGAKILAANVAPSIVSKPPVQSRYSTFKLGMRRSSTNWLATVSDAQLAELTTTSTFSGPPPA